MPTSWNPTDQETQYTEDVLEYLFATDGVEEASPVEPASGDGGDSPSPSPVLSASPRTDRWSSVILPLVEAVVGLGSLASAPAFISSALNPVRLMEKCCCMNYVTSLNPTYFNILW